MIYSFKQKSQDFIVEEILPFKLKGKGDAFFVFFEKRNLNTMDVVNHLCKELEISRLTLWIAGLKDKNAITRQRISIYKSALKKMWGEKAFLNALSEVARVIKTDWHEKPIGMTDRVSNMFYIRLRATQAVGQTDKENIQNRVTQLLEKWFPNFFGEQRFGINFQNIKMGKELLTGKLHFKEKFETKFKLQAYASHLFNEYLKARIYNKRALLDGDILQYKDTLGVYDLKENSVSSLPKEHEKNKFFYFPGARSELQSYNKEMAVTWPVFGFNTLLCPEKTKAHQVEQAFMKKYEVNEKALAMYKQQNIFWHRRALRVNPKEILFRFQNDDILLQFELPGGAYASILIDELLKEVG